MTSGSGAGKGNDMRSIMTTTTRQGHGQAEAEPHYVVCESAEGWSLHAPGSTDAEIASGDAPALVSGAWEGEDHEIPEWAHEALEGLDAEPRLEPGDILTGGEGEDRGTGTVHDVTDGWATVAWRGSRETTVEPVEALLSRCEVVGRDEF